MTWAPSRFFSPQGEVSSLCARSHATSPLGRSSLVRAVRIPFILKFDRFGSFDSSGRLPWVLPLDNLRILHTTLPIDS
ncbi:hypothetical protein TPAR_01280 [Tolypocladium paradoxum]|uniref:Uncharacterized protein n=1 Tax=Tolypocladium paradoxum TaxID=94208 RepID=A0A2S4L7S7_9HYPO|nr:hypothetical protein TPAR_01280 [Tolypocladium paradoxum]